MHEEAILQIFFNIFACSTSSVYIRIDFLHLKMVSFIRSKVRVFSRDSQSSNCNNLLIFS